MIAIDNCIISSLSKINRLDILKNLKGIFTSPGVFEEAINSEIEIIVNSISQALDEWLEIKSLEKPQEISKVQEKYRALSYVDCELILLCIEYNCILLTDDTKLLKIAENKFNISTFDLCELLLSFKRKRILKLDDINQIIEDLEKKDRYKFSKDNFVLLLQ